MVVDSHFSLGIVTEKYLRKIV